MCGIAGFFTGSKTGWSNGSNSVLDMMSEAIGHRGPDSNGTWRDRAAGIGLAHRRLAIIDLSRAGHQPMHSSNKRYVITYNGEIYNHASLRELLSAEGRAPAWRGTSDTETLLACVCAWGMERTLRETVGMFAFALWDSEQRVLTLARDRMGEKPLYYGVQGNTFIFASELKAIRCHPEFDGEVDRRAVELFLQFNYIPSPRSIYRGIRKLPAGSYVQISANRMDAEPTEYWSFAEGAEQAAGQRSDKSMAEMADGLEAVLGTAIERQLMADVPLGALFSGGIDSSTIVALMQARSARKAKTFTIGFEEQSHDESGYARAIASHLGTEHTEVRLSGRAALDLIPKMPNVYDEPFADTSQLPTYLLMQLTRENVTVALSGDGADELFGGYSRYSTIPKLWQSMRAVPYPIRHSVGQVVGMLPGRWTGARGRRLGEALVGSASSDALYLSAITQNVRSDAFVRGDTLADDLLTSPDKWPLQGEGQARVMALDAITYLPDDILAKVDRASMAVSLETRAPFLDRDVVEFSWRVPQKMKIQNGRGKLVLRSVLSRYVPDSLIERPKMGFGVPVDAWLRGPLVDFAENALSRKRLSEEGFLDPDAVRQMWKMHLSGDGEFGYQLWSILMFQAWLDSTSFGSLAQAKVA